MRLQIVYAALRFFNVPHPGAGQYQTSCLPLRFIARTEPEGRQSSFAILAPLPEGL